MRRIWLKYKNAKADFGVFSCGKTVGWKTKQEMAWLVKQEQVLAEEKEELKKVDITALQHLNFFYFTS